MAIDPQKQAFLAGQIAVSTDVDNGVATATATPHTGSTGQRGKIFGLGFSADFSAAVAAIVAITLTFTDINGTARTLVFRWDFALGPCVLALPGVLAVQEGTALVATLGASGTGGTTGRIVLYYSEA